MKFPISAHIYHDASRAKMKNTHSPRGEFLTADLLNMYICTTNYGTNPSSPGFPKQLVEHVVRTPSLR
jgi:hypothetical protein